MTFALIDLGSNTFHLLIAEVDQTAPFTFRVIFRKSFFTSLSKGGGKIILPEIFTGAVDAIHEMKKVILSHNIDKIKITGTAVLRTANNSREFCEIVESVIGYPVSVIDGIQEARYIAEGTGLHPALQSGNHLIMDIGGGSTEFIFLKNGEVEWLTSTPLGVGVLKQLFFPNEMVTHEEIEKAESYFDQHLAFLTEDFQLDNLQSLAGASGTFEALELLLFGESVYGSGVRDIEIKQFEDIYDQLVFSPLEFRINYPNMPRKRAELIPVGLILIRYVLNKTKPVTLKAVHYALKEGVLKELAISC